jgi:hypothetical protein
MGWNTIRKSQSVVLRGTNQQSATDAGLLWTPPGYSHESVSPITGARSVYLSREGCAIRRYTLQNRSGSTVNAGIGFRLAKNYWRAGQFTAAGVYTDDTEDAQDLGANDFILGADAVNDGFVILSEVPLSWVSINVGTAEVDNAGADLDHAVTYSNAAGTGWTALGANAALTDQFTTTNSVYATGALEFVWLPPSDHGKVTNIATIPNGYYALRVMAASTGAGDTAALATAIEVGTLKAVESIADNQLLSSAQEAWQEHHADAVVAYFSVANAGNYVIAEATSC